MKNIFILLAIAVTFCGCKKDELKSLEGTRWEYNSGREGDWVFELRFASTQFTYTVYGMEEDEPLTVSGTYIYDHPEVTVDTGPGTFYFGNPGIVKGSTLKIEVFVGDIGSLMEFKKQ